MTPNTQYRPSTRFRRWRAYSTNWMANELCNPHRPRRCCQLAPMIPDRLQYWGCCYWKLSPPRFLRQWNVLLRDWLVRLGCRKWLQLVRIDLFVTHLPFFTTVSLSGMSRGNILCFDSSQTLKWCCQEFTADGTVSCLAFNEDDTRLLAGYDRGRIVMFDASNGKILRNLAELATPNAGILNIRWTDKPALALCSDSGGSVWSLNFTRRLGVRGCESRCLFSGARGEVCTFEPLLMNGEDHPLRNYTIAALATLSKFFVVMVRPRLRVIKFHPLPGQLDCLPLLSWQLVLIQLADTTKTVDPVLATARGNNLFFHQLAFNGGKISLLFLR